MQDTPVVLLHGPRQAGKTTLVKQLVEQGHAKSYVNLDRYSNLVAAREDPIGFLDGFPESVAIDEVQLAPALYRAIKSKVDDDRQAGRYLLTGSASTLFLPEIAEALVGRIEIHELMPLSQGELHHRREEYVDALFSQDAPDWSSAEVSKADLIPEILRGGFPEAVARKKPDRVRAWHHAYLETILQREVPRLTNVRDLNDLVKLQSLLAARSSSLLNFSEISRSIGVPLSTVRDHFSLLQAVFLIDVIPAWSGDLGKRLVRSPKVYFHDPGLMASLLELDANRVLRNTTQLGALFETFVVAELRKAVSWSRTQPRIYHFRTSDQHEVDLILEDRRGRIVAVEVKASSTIKQEHARGLRFLQQSMKDHFHRGIILYLGREVVPIGDRLQAVPVSALWADKK